MKTPAGTMKKCSAVDFVFWGIGGLAGVLCGLNAAAQPQGLLHSKMFWVALLAALSLLAAPLLLRPKLKQNLLLLLSTLFLIELFLQVAGWCGLLPGMHTMLYYPWARVYWTGEGLGNSIRNRYGWHYPEFNLSATNRIALIGDSFVEGKEVNRRDNMGVKLGAQLAGPWRDFSVLSLGRSGTGPAQYYEVLQYAHKHFQVHEAILLLYLGNDISDCTAATALSPESHFIYYQLDPAGQLMLTPPDQTDCARYRADLETPHQPLWRSVPWILSSHCMSAQIPINVRNALAYRRRQFGRDGTDHPERYAPRDAELARLGLKAATFAVNPDPDTREAMLIMQGILQRAADYCAAHQIRLRLVTIPFFPKDFYDTQQGAAWSARIGDYDFLKPEREITAWAKAHNLPVLPLGEWMHRQKLDVSAIRALYFTGGSGHFTEAGHRFIADAMAENFYPGVK